MQNVYAQALFKILESDIKPHEAVRNLREHLTMRGRLSLLPKIGTALGRLLERQQASETRLYVAREKDAKRAVKEAVAMLDLKNGDMQVCVDQSFIGGWRLQEKNRLTDASYKKHLLSIYNSATQS